jgi:hypothetical protein
MDAGETVSNSMTSQAAAGEVIARAALHQLGLHLDPNALDHVALTDALLSTHDNARAEARRRTFVGDATAPARELCRLRRTSRYVIDPAEPVQQIQIWPA